ncbi:DNA polymerase III subunit epsilon [Candidatus Pantoea carbekii]|uniref:DNA polymerase III subunit epsilon n=1 Tax=Candidatus Pantoea carbekii TaxID=1235990 RepID=U3U8Q6_9GAMM|nr:DNA polymerase III subunit epsilon [Candidatus Pantoea carbekii]AKC32258.1 DNA polymerase III epsilon subunit DnaQ [Candidatus Pantoea carbekii]BAO00794.1 DNA polymerase III, epsilon subunit [Candidatus Pantoea carbekii]
MSIIKNRQIFLDTETTGMNATGPHYKGHRIIEIGAVEVINRRLTKKNFHVYLKPDRSIDPEAFKIHGISNEFLSDKPTFSDISNEFLEYIHGAELIIHNASFDIGFIDHEFGMLNSSIGRVETFCQITDSLALARKLFPGKRNTLDALCNRYEIDRTKRTFHGALLDAEILSEVFLTMTGGQTSLLFLDHEQCAHQSSNAPYSKHITHSMSSVDLRVLNADHKELIEHNRRLDLLQKISGLCLWRK